MYKETQRGSLALCLKTLLNKQSILSYTPFSHTSCTHLVYPPISPALGITLVPREIEDNGYAKFWEVNKVSGPSENSE